MQTENDCLLNGGFQPRRYRPGGVGNWSGHLPFANDLVASADPKLLVELGTHYGESYFGFCQAIAENNVACLSYAVDTWVGEPHAGYYDERVFSDVNSYNEANYSSFSHLLRTTFDEANAQFADDSIDILHIDGLHTYEAISHDFQLWLPKVKPGGIVLLHDIIARHEDFGVWKLWDELEGLGDRFAFTHSWGLGVFRKPGPALSGTGLLRCLFDADRDRREHIRKFYSLCALKLEYEHARTHRHYAAASRVLVQVYPFFEAGYSAENVYTADLKPGQWQRITIDLGSGIGNGPLRIDLAERPAIIDLAGIRIRKAVNNEILWSAEGSSETASLGLGGTITRFEASDKSTFCRFLSFGSDPQLFLPSFDADHFDQPLLLDIWVRLHVEISSLLPILRRLADSGALKQQETIEDLTAKCASISSERDSLLAAHRKLQTELYVSKTELAEELKVKRTLQEKYGELQNKYQHLEKAQQDLQGTEQHLNKVRENLEAKHRELESNRQALTNEHAVLKKEYGALEKKYEAMRKNYTDMEQTLQGVLTSHSWRITGPFRDFMLHVRPRGK
jgi:hypothetical protein